MTLTSRYAWDESFERALLDHVESVPTQVVDGPDLDLPLNRDLTVKKHTKRATIQQLPTGATWRGHRITVAIRLQPHRGRRGCGQVVLGNFRNCLTFRSGNRVAKVFVGGSVQACGFTSVDEFHEFMASTLPTIGPASDLDESETRVHLAITDARLDVPGPIHLRPLARACARRMVDREVLDFNPSEFAGVRFKVGHPSDDSKMVSVVLRAGGSVKVFLGSPGKDVDAELDMVWNRVREIIRID